MAGGFSLIELLTSIAIMTAILSVIAFSQGKYTNGASVKADSNNISLSLRQAEVYGVSVKELTPGSDDFTPAYGVEFNLVQGSGANNAYVYFADKGSQNKIYDNVWTCPISPVSECLDKIDLSKGNTISSLCIIYATDPTDVGTCNIGRLDITFLRPSTEARIVFFSNTGVLLNPAPVRGARINLLSTGGQTNSVIVYTTGHISVQ